MASDSAGIDRDALLDVYHRLAAIPFTFQSEERVHELLERAGVSAEVSNMAVDYLAAVEDADAWQEELLCRLRGVVGDEVLEAIAEAAGAVCDRGSHLRAVAARAVADATAVPARTEQEGRRLAKLARLEDEVAELKASVLQLVALYDDEDDEEKHRSCRCDFSHQRAHDALLDFENGRLAGVVEVLDDIVSFDAVHERGVHPKQLLAFVGQHQWQEPALVWRLVAHGVQAREHFRDLQEAKETIDHLRRSLRACAALAETATGPAS